MQEKTTKPKDHPYRRQPSQAFWQNAIENTHPLDITDWYKRKFSLSNQRIATAGSCFAQHIGRELRDKGFRYVDTEPAPGFLQPVRRPEYGYGMYSARYGNIYTSRQLLQLAQRALGELQPAERVWCKGDGFVDPFRPTIEPTPYTTTEEVEFSRQDHLKRVVEVFENTDVFVFTLGLTEAWLANEDGAAFPLCPGTSAGGMYDDKKYKFVNLNFAQIRADLESFFTRLRAVNGNMRFMLTVSPVPLMATATDNQVMVATSYSKSVLRAVAGYLADKYPYVDYFPSYEIISAHVMRGEFYNPDMRSVSKHGVDHVMKQFFKEHEPPQKIPRKRVLRQEEDPDDLVCDEELLAVFGE